MKRSSPRLERKFSGEERKFEMPVEGCQCLNKGNALASIPAERIKAIHSRVRCSQLVGGRRMLYGLPVANTPATQETTQ